MKLNELKMREREVRFKSDTDKKFYRKYQDKDCVVAYNKNKHQNRVYVIIKGNDKFYALLFDMWYMHIYDLKTLHKNVKNEDEELTIVDEKEYGNLKKYIILEALDGK